MVKKYFFLFFHGEYVREVSGQVFVYFSSYVDLLARFAGYTVDDDSLELVGHGVPGVVVWPLPKSKASGLAAVLLDHSWPFGGCQRRLSHAFGRSR